VGGNIVGTESTSSLLEVFKPSLSASTIANSNQKIFDTFAQVCQAGTYIPNRRLQNLLLDGELLKKRMFQHCLQNILFFVDTFRKMPGGNETYLADQNLQKILQSMAHYSDDRLECRKKNIECVYMASSASPEHCLCYPHHSSEPIVIGAEVKGVENSIRSCYPQLLIACGCSSMKLKDLGVATEDAVVPGIAMAGSCIQFCAVYLVKNSFPVLVALSPELNPSGSYYEQEMIAEWCLRLVRFGIETGGLLDRVERVDALSPSKIILNMDEFFAKPVRNSRKGSHQQERHSGQLQASDITSNKSIFMNEIMRMYEVLRLACACSENTCVLFPSGVVSVPGEDVEHSKELREGLIAGCAKHGFDMEMDYRPLILFPLLAPTDGWRNDKPPSMLFPSYLEQLQLAVSTLNFARIAHLDLRPANIMWRAINDLAVELRVIDFEDAVRFDYVIPKDLIETVVRTCDRRYPFQSGDESSVQLAQEFHNNFFLDAISTWLPDEELRFSSYMFRNGETILRRNLLGTQTIT